MARFSAMVDMARTADDVKAALVKERGDLAASPPRADTMPTYPWGLSLSLDEDALKKLGIDAGDLPGVGEMVHFCAMAKVTSASESEREGTDGSKETCRRVELQITHLGLENEDQENRDWYGGTMSEDKADAA